MSKFRVVGENAYAYVYNSLTGQRVKHDQTWQQIKETIFENALTFSNTFRKNDDELKYAIYSYLVKDPHNDNSVKLIIRFHSTGYFNFKGSIPAIKKIFYKSLLCIKPSIDKLNRGNIKHDISQVWMIDESFMDSGMPVTDRVFPRSNNNFGSNINYFRGYDLICNFNPRSIHYTKEQLELDSDIFWDQIATCIANYIANTNAINDIVEILEKVEGVAKNESTD